MAHSRRITLTTHREIVRMAEQYKQDKNTPCGLAVLAQRLGALPEIRRLCCRFDDRTRYPLKKQAVFTLHPKNPAIYLLGWREGEWTSVHDHGASQVGIYMLQGRVAENLFATMPTSTKDRKTLVEWSRMVQQGDTITCPENYVHAMGNIYPETAVTLHVYGPDLHDMRLYERKKGGVLKFKDVWHNANEPQG